MALWRLKLKNQNELSKGPNLYLQQQKIDSNEKEKKTF